MKMLNKKIVFLTGTRADFGKLKSLITILEKQTEFNVHLFVTGMHLLPEYGYTVNEIVNSKFSNITKFDNSADGKMEMSLSKTIEGFSNYLSDLKPDLVVVHGDRLEALAGAIVSSINNTLVAHIEGGEISGTIDESIRHAISKFSHIHFTSDEESKQRLIKLGENPKNINVNNSIFIDCDDKALQFNSGENITITNNKFLNCKQPIRIPRYIKNYQAKNNIMTGVANHYYLRSKK